MSHNNTEYLDIVDKNNNIIGQAPKDSVHTQNLLHRASHIILIYNNYIFLQLRSKNKKQFPHKWDISAAGHVVAGESYLECAIRETKEELNLNLQGLADSPESLNSPNPQHSQHSPNLQNSPNPVSLIELSTLPASPHTGNEFIQIYLADYSKQQNMPKIILQSFEITTGGWFDIAYIAHWINQNPHDFAGCFDLIFQEFLSYLNSTKNI